MMTSPSNCCHIDNIGADENLLTLTKEEVEAFLRECMNSYISYENPIAREVIRKMWQFVGQPLKRGE